MFIAWQARYDRPSRQRSRPTSRGGIASVEARGGRVWGTQYLACAVRSVALLGLGDVIAFCFPGVLLLATDLDAFVAGDLLFIRRS